MNNGTTSQFNDMDETVPGMGWAGILVMFAGVFGGMVLSVSTWPLFILMAPLGDEAMTASETILAPVVIAILVMIGGRPRGRRQLGWFALIALAISFFGHLASYLAGMAQAVAGPSRDYFITHAVFVMLAGPVCVVGVLVMRRLGMLPQLDASDLANASFWLALALPSLLAAALVLDLLDGAGLLISAEGRESPATRLWGPVLLAGFLVMADARPIRTAHWWTLCGVIALVSVGGVAIFALVQRYMAADGIGLFTHPAAFAATALFQFATSRLIRVAAGSSGPWCKTDDAEERAARNGIPPPQ